MKFVDLEMHHIWNNDTYTDDSVLTLRTQGCDCCVEHVPLSLDNLNTAIKETEEFLRELVSKRKELYGDTNETTKQ